MSNWRELMDEAEQALIDAITSGDGFVEVTAEDLGLDRRCGRKFWIDEVNEVLVCSAGNDRALQYYGGFEYIDKGYRREIGNYVLYESEETTGRVSEALVHYYDKQKEKNNADDE